MSNGRTSAELVEILRVHVLSFSFCLFLDPFSILMCLPGFFFWLVLLFFIFTSIYLTYMIIHSFLIYFFNILSNQKGFFFFGSFSFHTFLLPLFS